MTLHHIVQLDNSEGLAKVVLFTGLSHSMLVHPTLHGEPLLTAQPFYYLEDLESVAQLSYEHGQNVLSPEQVDYLIDNYLFEYCKLDVRSRMSSKVTRAQYWSQDGRDFYAAFDRQHTRGLVLDLANDPSVLSIRPVDSADTVDLSDWQIARNYTSAALEEYLSALREVLTKKVWVEIVPTDERDGYFGKLRVVECDDDLIDHSQAMTLDHLTIRRIPTSAVDVPLGAAAALGIVDSLPLVRVTATKLHTPVLLSHFFAGIKEVTPLRAFVGFYNVLEYYFEEAPLLAARTARTELEQLTCVIELLTSEMDVAAFMAQLSPIPAAAMATIMLTSSGVPIAGFAPAANQPWRPELARWLYDIRCAIVHSKKTRKGRPTASFEPYSAEAQSVAISLPVIRWLSVLCIEKDYSLRCPAS